MFRVFKVSELSVYPYSVLMILGGALCFVCFLVLSLIRHKEAQDETIFVSIVLVVSIIAALPASMVVDSLFKLIETGKFEIKGATFYGGLISAIIIFTVALAIKRKKQVGVYERLRDLVPGICFGHCLGRIGCFLGGCCFGSPTNSIFGVIFPEGSLPYEYYGGPVKVHPTQLYEAVFLLILGVIFLIFNFKDSFPLYLIMYGAGRLCIEFFRNDDRGAVGLPMSPAQLISVILIFTGAIIIAVKRKKST